MPCKVTTSSWSKDLQIGLDCKKYVVELKRYVGCCKEEYEIFVNDRQLVDHGLTFSPWGPLCTSAGKYQWEQDGHTFYLMYEGFPCQRQNKLFRLFIDGVDVDTGLEFTAFWRRRACQMAILASVLVFIAVLVYVLAFAVFNVDAKYVGAFSILNTMCAFGLAYGIVAVVIFVRLRRKRRLYSSASSYSSADYKTFRNVPV